jgi:hypothetical protein
MCAEGLPCQVVPDMPEACYGLRFHGVYHVIVPLRTLAGAGGRMNVTMTVTPEMHSEKTRTLRDGLRPRTSHPRQKAMRSWWTQWSSGPAVFTWIARCATPVGVYLFPPVGNGGRSSGANSVISR